MKPQFTRRLVRGASFSSIAAIVADARDGIHREVWHIAWPSVLTFLLMTTNAIIDRAFVGRLGRDALAAVGVGGQLIFLLVSLSMAVSVGTTALVARFTGAQEPEDSARATGQSLSLSGYMGILCTLAVFAALPWYLNLMQLTPSAHREARAFLFPSLFGCR